MDHWSEEEDYRRAFETIAQQSAQALMFNGLGGNFTYRKLIAELALKYRLPSIGWFPDVVENGPGLLSYAADFSKSDLRLGTLPDIMAEQVAEILKGTKVADIPVYQPTKFILAINLKTAKALSLEIPASLLASADEVIE